jgi:protein-S-isoprenylcysteine O-methyltransferase Ste14
VLIKADHQLVRIGIYKYVRHPAYTGTLIAHLGLGLSFGSWLSLSLSLVPYVLAAMYRMRVEEQALTEAFGNDYVEYAKQTKRLIPGLY